MAFFGKTNNVLIFLTIICEWPFPKPNMHVFVFVNEWLSLFSTVKNKRLEGVRGVS